MPEVSWWCRLSVPFGLSEDLTKEPPNGVKEQRFSLFVPIRCEPKPSIIGKPDRFPELGTHQSVWVGEFAKEL